MKKQYLTIRECYLFEAIKKVIKREGIPIYEGMLKQELKADFNRFPIHLLPTTLAALQRRRLIEITRDSEGSILDLIKK